MLNLSAVQYTSYTTGQYTTLKYTHHLGEGAYGSVYELEPLPGQTQALVCKEIDLNSARIQRNLQKLNMAKRDILRNTIDELYSLETMGLLEGYARKDNTYYIIMKKVSGKIADPNAYSDHLSSFFAMRDCHRQNVTHNDTHNKNFIIDNMHQGKAIDFGWSRDASFVNILYDVIGFFQHRDIPFKKIRLFFWLDFLQYIQKHPVQFLGKTLYWGILLYGAFWGLPINVLSQSVCQTLLTSHVLHQVFLELRGFALTQQHFVAAAVEGALSALSFTIPFRIRRRINDFVMENDFMSNYVYRYILKPIYLVGLAISFIQVNRLLTNCSIFLKQGWDLIKNKMPWSSMGGLVAKTPAPTLVNAALLYYPIKEGLKFIDDAIIKPFEPDCITTARADLYFQYHPTLYAKAVDTSVKNVVKSAFQTCMPLSRPSPER